MQDFNPQLVRALANGDQEAHEQVKSLPLSVRMGLGIAVEQMQREESIVPMNSGFSVFEQQKSSYVDDDAVAEAMQRRMDLERENLERQREAQEKFIEEQTRLAIERARCGLPRNDMLPR